MSMGAEVKEENISSPPLSSVSSLSTAQRMTRRGLLALGAVSGALAVTGGIGSTVCSLSHSAKLRGIQEECDQAMAIYVRDRLHSSSGAIPSEQWRRKMATTLKECVIPRDWNSDGIESQGALRYHIGDFHFDEIMIEVPDSKLGKNVKAERWLGRCGCTARHTVLDAAKNGFADVRIY